MNSTVEKPRLISWGLTTGCNLRCIPRHATAQEPASPLDLPTAEALSLIKQVSRYTQPDLVLSGGDPFFAEGMT